MTDTQEPLTDDDPDEDSDDDSTESVSTRPPYTNDVLAFFLIGSIIGGVGADGLGVVALSSVPDEVLLSWVVMTGTATVWAFGRDAIAAWRTG